MVCGLNLEEAASGLRENGLGCLRARAVFCSAAGTVDSVPTLSGSPGLPESKGHAGDRVRRVRREVLLRHIVSNFQEESSKQMIFWVFLEHRARAKTVNAVSGCIFF